MFVINELWVCNSLQIGNDRKFGFFKAVWPAGFG